MLSEVLAVAIGGAFGAVCRYLITFIPFSSSFPLATFTANLLGAVFIGIVCQLSIKGLDPKAVLLLKTGFCGGFTTFSTFSSECLVMIQEGKLAVASLYIFLSVVLCLIGVWTGSKMAQNIV